MATRGPAMVPTRRDERWSMDFMHDPLQDERRHRMLTVVDQYMREALATAARGSFSAHDVIEVLNRLSRCHRKPAVMQVANAPKMGDGVRFARPRCWAYRKNVGLDFSRPRKPTDNAHVFESLEDAEKTLTSWQGDYNAVRQHSALGMLTPLGIR